MKKDRPRHSNKVLLEHILHWGERIEKSLRGKSLEQFMSNADLREACLYRLQVIGEAVNNISYGFRRKHPELGWERWVAFRHQLVHGYESTDLTSAYQVMTADLHQFMAAIRELMREM
jgi:uncharacterized protein with HEPN domain